ncbi:hypothetical protein [Phenylobacterium sp.]|uniref:hypothetical protein n=1 Tax=Phenylobacterium sp. TaxID=1871053 RepID=UPI0035B41D1D
MNAAHPREAEPRPARRARAGRPGRADDGLVVVRPVEGGWSVTSRHWGERLLFCSGAAAESQARRMSECLAKLGVDVRVDVYDRRDLLAGCFRVFADP